MVLHFLGRILSVVLCAVALGTASASAQDAASLVKVELLAEPSAIVPGEPFTVGIKLSMKQHWHTYWRNPGDSGEPTQVTWKLPQGFVAGELQWPAPSLIRVGPAANFGYEGETILLARVTPPRDLKSGASVDLAADVAYLVCEKICIPGEASVSLSLSVAEPGAPSRDKAAFEAARSRLPQPSPWNASFSADTKAITLSLRSADLRGDAIRSATFFPYDNTLIDNAARQGLRADGQTTRLTIERSQIAKQVPQRIEGVLVLEEDVGGKIVPHAFAIDATRSAVPAAGEGGMTLLYAVVSALIAGVILNFMPCVFPVLSVKILYLTEHRAETPRRIRLHGIAYVLGILASFTMLAGVLQGLRAGGAEVGWGFQLQSPLTVAALAFILFALGLSLSGILTIGTSLTRIGGSRLLQSGGLSGSFFAGVLATVVATPCTAPFMGASIGFALVQPFAVGLVVFLALGFGLGLPFLALTFAPGLQRLLPRPGRWMETLKQALAFPLYATVAWLIWVLSFQVGASGLLAALAALVLIAFGAWIFRVSQEQGHASGRVLQGMTAAMVAGVVALTVLIDRDRPTAANAGYASKASSEAFSQQKLDALLASGQPVFVNMTAAWCITCLVNERTALSTDAVREMFAGKRVAYLKGDWTNRNPEITRLLERFGRSGVPLYVLYRSGGEAVVLPQILTQSLVLDALQEI
ncbi:protein-disulfide reductase DsbD domain-containing protein [Bradyrhizobium sp.]|uniref:protein-disulfide reductase DsbD family protein n=1 Tax=Bradyrhizobium sp. TaxID=376 RepID=UPI001D6C32EB|nr:protein-disulfide reductase DsbD domain-containing protein [Bradyrhizobium sp.]MBI5319021.1 thioredoxin family protein [Bradyrhizobium sp.]